MHEVLVNRLGGLSLPRKSVVRLTDRPDMTLDVYCGRKTTMQQLMGYNFLDFKTSFFGSFLGYIPRLASKYRWQEFPAVITILGNTPNLAQWEVLGNMKF